MKNVFSSVILISTLLFGAVDAKADSPLTSTSLHIGHESNAMVALALKTKTINAKQLAYLTGNASLPEKLAVISAFGYGDHMSAVFTSIDANFSTVRKDSTKFTNDDKFVLAYAQGLADYFNISKTNKYFESIDFENEKRESAIWVMNLCVMQRLLDDREEWCNIYLRKQAIQNSKNLVRDLKEETLTKGLYEHLDIYKGVCDEKE